MTVPGTRTADVNGHCDPRFAGVREVFGTSFTEDDEWGAAVCVHAAGRRVIDLWGGWRNRARTLAWQRDTMVNAYSVGKGIVALLAVDSLGRGELSLDTAVASLWPAFAAHGKDTITVRQLLCHQAGLPAIRPLLPAAAKYDWPRMCAVLADEKPFWEPGTAHGYHANTWGFLVGEVLRRATGMDIAQLLRRRLTGPLGLDYYWGVPAALHRRISAVMLTQQFSLAEQRAQIQAMNRRGEDSPAMRSYFNPPGISGFGSVNTRAWRNAVIPSTNGHGTARAVAGMYNALWDSNGPLHIDNDLLAEATRIHSDGPDVVQQRPSRFGLGFQLPQPGRPIGPGPHAFGHFGYGGSLGFADPDIPLSFGYVTNRPGERFLSTRALRVVDAVYEALGK